MNLFSLKIAPSAPILVNDPTLQFTFWRTLISPQLTWKKSKTKHHNNKNNFCLCPHPRNMMICQFTSSVKNLMTRFQRQIRLSHVHKSLKTAWRRFCWKQPNPGCGGKETLEGFMALFCCYPEPRMIYSKYDIGKIHGLTERKLNILLWSN